MFVVCICVCWLLNYLVGGLEHLLFFHLLGIIIPTDFHIYHYQSG